MDEDSNLSIIDFGAWGLKKILDGHLAGLLQPPGFDATWSASFSSAGVLDMAFSGAKAKTMELAGYATDYLFRTWSAPDPVELARLESQATVSGDPHILTVQGDKFDVRGFHRTIFNMHSSSGASLNVYFECFTYTLAPEDPRSIDVTYCPLPPPMPSFNTTTTSSPNPPLGRSSL